MTDPLDLLQLHLGHRFSDPGLLRLALTHRSARRQHNERLEFLGDAVLGFLIAEALSQRFTGASEGELTRLRARLVNGDALAALALELRLGSFLELGLGERKSGGHRRASILADALEAVICAVYLDAGMDVCRERVLSLFGPTLDQLQPGEELKDPKTRLQEWLQSRALERPHYHLIDEQEQAGVWQFTVECRVPALDQPCHGNGGTRRAAEQTAAALALEHLQAHV
ncbi:MAG: ribonuclease III [Immundisolibacter sp.]|uniref:ribonuclease III n=1 Tax=Immundisolibacter sp. TaxID=1934948 RepID=UPI0035618A42